MKIALDPYMLRRVPLTGLPGLVADLPFLLLPMYRWSGPDEDERPVLEREGVRLVLEPHPDDFVEDGRAGARESSAHNLELVRRYLAKHGGAG
jgi:hypothetical protein